eukprot:Gb_09732 [translate_table: standard]
MMRDTCQSKAMEHRSQICLHFQKKALILEVVQCYLNSSLILHTDQLLSSIFQL